MNRNTLRKRIALFALATLAITGLANASVPAQLQSEQGQIVLKSYTPYVGVEPFEYYQYVPSNADLSKLAIAVVVHGTLNTNDLSGRSDAFSMAEYWQLVAEEKQIMIISPAYSENNYGGDDGPSCSGCMSYGGYRGLFGRHYDGIDARDTDADSVLNRLIENYQTQYPGVFEQKFYLTGHSAGGQFTGRYIIMNHDKIKAAVIGSAGHLPLPDNTIGWPDGMTQASNGYGDPINLKWTDNQTIRTVTLDPENARWATVANMKITTLIGENEDPDHVNLATNFTADMRTEGGVSDSAEGIQLAVVGGTGHDGNKLSPATIDALLPSVRNQWANSAGQTTSWPENPRYTFTITESQYVRIDLNSEETDTYLYLLNSQETILAEDDDSGAGSNSKVKISLNPGTYHIVAGTKTAGESGTYDIAINIPVKKQLYPLPQNDGYRLDWGYNGLFGKQTTASRWCAQNTPFERSSSWELDSGVGATEPTKSLFDGGVCNHSGCDAYKNIECSNYSELTEYQSYTCAEYSDTIINHETANRAYCVITEEIIEEEVETCTGWWWYENCTTEIQTTTAYTTTWFTTGSDENLGTDNTTSVTLITDPANPDGYITGECPVNPAPPVVTLTSSSLANDILHVKGTATDINGDIDQVYLGFPPAFGTTCIVNGTTTTCDLDVSGLAAGNHTASFYAIDLEGQESNIISIEFVIPANTAPEIINVAYSVNSRDMTVTADATDVDNNLEGVRLEYANDIGGIDCTNSGGNQYTCDLVHHPLGTYVFILAAYDTEGLRTESEEFTATFNDAPQCFTDTNTNHINADRAHMLYGILIYANGSDDYLGMSTTSTSLELDGSGNWQKVTSCP